MTPPDLTHPVPTRTSPERTLDQPLDLLVLPGDGIGPEICDAATTVLSTALGQAGVAWAGRSRPIGFAALAEAGTTMPQEVLEEALEADGVVLGPVSHLDYPPVAEGGVNPSGLLRKRLDLFANVRPARTVEGLPSPLGRSFDLVIVRENTEGFYADRTMFAGSGEFMPTEDVALAVRKVTRAGSERIVRHAYELARDRGCKVTVVHKANVLRLSDGLFLEAARRVGADYPDVEREELLVDAVAALLIRDPAQFGVIVTTNMFGDILSDEATELSGSIGLAASLNVGHEHAVAQAQHGSAPTLAGLGVANPASLIGSTAMLLTWLGERRGDPRLGEAGRRIQLAVDRTVRVPKTRTRDLGGMADTHTFVSAVCERLSSWED